MTGPLASTTTGRPAAVLLDEHAMDAPPWTTSASVPVDLDLEQQRIGVAVADLIARMSGPRLSAAALDRVAGRIAGLLIDAHEVRVLRALRDADEALPDDARDPA